MEKRNRQIQLSTASALIGVALLIGFIGGSRDREIFNFLAPVVGLPKSDKSIDLSSVENTYKVLREKFDGDLDKEKLIIGASKGLVEAAGDDYTTYLSPKENDEFQKNLTGDVGAGIGAEIGVRNDLPTVVRPLKDNPAIRAGLLAGDVILAVNDEAVSGLKIDQIISKIKGQPDTTVKIKIARKVGDKIDEKEFSIVRKTINNPSVDLSFDGSIAILKISRFDHETGGLARKYAQQIIDKKLTRVIVDLRGNGGGYVSAARDVTSLWLDKNQLIVTEKKAQTTIDEVRSTGNNLLANIKTIVLTDKGSASASEIVVGALKDHKKAEILGEQTFGKGSVQEPIEINGGSLIKVTVAKWYTPSGTNIGEKGIEPDHKVELSLDDINNNRDPQMESAKNKLK